jgi:hypothetical protein
MLKIDKDIFINTWEQFSEHFTSQNPDWLNLYDNSNEWSAKFLGGKKSCSKSSPIGNFFKMKFSELRYRTEDGSFDLVFSFSSNYSKLGYLHKTEIDFFDIEGWFYPTMYDVIIEVENDCRCSWQEMAKLTWVRCPLKVLVTYNWHPFDTLIWQTETKMLVDTFSNIIHQSNQNFKDNSQTEYLLIIGNNADKKLSWSYHKFDSDGQHEEEKRQLTRYCQKQG